MKKLSYKNNNLNIALSIPPEDNFSENKRMSLLCVIITLEAQCRKIHPLGDGGGGPSARLASSQSLGPQWWEATQQLG